MARHDHALQREALFAEHEAEAEGELAPAEPSPGSHLGMETYHLSARIRRVDPPHPSQSDSGDASLGSSAPPRHGRTVVNSDSIEGQAKAVIEEEEPGEPKITVTDTINPTLAYNATITHGGVAPGATEFGLTEWTANVSGFEALAASGAYAVTATINCPIEWEVHDLGRTNVASASDPALTRANYSTAASDLTPNMSSDGGRPPRTQFWARDLTERHEQFHAGDFKTRGQAAFNLAQTWVGTQTASSEDEAKRKVDAIPGRMRTYIVANYIPGAETRAYGDGAPSYATRAAAIAALVDSSHR
jgi:hypothetical protein